MRKQPTKKSNLSRSLTMTLRAEAKRYGIILEINKGKTIEDRGEITLDAPEGFQFDEELHGLVNEQGDDSDNGGLEPWVKTIKSALADVRENGPRIKKCPDDCPCKEVD